MLKNSRFHLFYSLRDEMEDTISRTDILVSTQKKLLESVKESKYKDDKDLNDFIARMGEDVENTEKRIGDVKIRLEKVKDLIKRKEGGEELLDKYTTEIFTALGLVAPADSKYAPQPEYIDNAKFKVGQHVVFKNGLGKEHQGTISRLPLKEIAEDGDDKYLILGDNDTGTYVIDEEDIKEE